MGMDAAMWKAQAQEEEEERNSSVPQMEDIIQVG